MNSIRDYFWYWHWVLSVIRDKNYDPGHYNISKWGHIKTMDGPIHTAWCAWGRFTCNWFTIGWHCWRKGHDWRSEHVGYRNEIVYETISPGHVKASFTGPKRAVKVTTCAYCGYYRGRSI